MEHIEAFGHRVQRIHCDTLELYRNSQLLQAVARIFQLPEVINRERGADWDSQYGPGETTEHMPLLGPANIPDAGPLVQWVLEQAQQVSGNDMSITKHWMNVMLPGSQGLCHAHSGGGDLVAIFYLQNLPGGSDLVLINNGRTGTKYTDYSDSDRFHIPVCTGDLILHDTDLWHAVGINNSEHPRICFVFHLTKKSL
jgi:hypothetical protein